MNEKARFPYVNTVEAAEAHVDRAKRRMSAARDRKGFAQDILARAEYELEARRIERLRAEELLHLMKWEKRTGHVQRTCGPGISGHDSGRGEDCMMCNLRMCTVCGQAEGDLAEKCPGKREVAG